MNRSNALSSKTDKSFNKLKGIFLSDLFEIMINKMVKDAII